MSEKLIQSLKFLKIGHPCLAFNSVDFDYPQYEIISRSVVIYSHNAYYVIGGKGHVTTESPGSPLSAIVKFYENTSPIGLGYEWKTGKRVRKVFFKLFFKVQWGALYLSKMVLKKVERLRKISFIFPKLERLRKVKVDFP